MFSSAWRYLRPDLLEEAGISVFDSWAATFGQVVTQVELAPEGGDSFRVKSRFARFRNIPEMLRMWHVFADVKTASQLNLPVPALAPRPGDGQRLPETVTVEPSPDLVHYVTELGRRAERVRSRAVAPEEDNMLKVSSDGRKAALDLRLVGLPQAIPGKAHAAAARIAAIWREHKDDVYLAPDDSPYLAELTRLQRAERAHHRNIDALRHAIKRHEQNITSLLDLAADIDAALARARTPAARNSP